MFMQDWVEILPLVHVDLTSVRMIHSSSKEEIPRRQVKSY
jgi:hypothetical protein